MRIFRRQTHGFTAPELVAVLACLALLIAFLIPPRLVHGFVDCVYKDEDGSRSTYVLFVPHDYRGDKPYPLILFLHGHGNRNWPTAVGLGPAIRKGGESLPFFVLFPTIEGRSSWTADSEETRRAIKVLDEVVSDYNIDQDRVYLTGLSNGGSGTWSFAARYPDRWAAIVPVAGAASPAIAPHIKHLPCWCFHGGADPVTPVSCARAMIDALRAAGGQPKYTEVAGYPHSVWNPAYANPELYEWLLKQTRPSERVKR